MKIKLCLHFDINKSIMIADTGAGRDLHGSLNSLLSEAVWGHYDRTIPKDSRSAKDWIPLNYIGANPPQSDAVTFGEFLEEHTILTKAERRAIKTSFTSNEIGKEYISQFQTLIEYLDYTSPQWGFSSQVIAEARALPYLSSGYFHILPSFFQLMNHLIDLDHLDFRIVFRTFGVDTAHVASEWNLYCCGRHPFFQPKKLLDGSQSDFPFDYRLHLPSHSAIIRHSHDGAHGQGVHMSYVDHQQVIFVAVWMLSLRCSIMLLTFFYCDMLCVFWFLD